MSNNLVLQLMYNLIILKMKNQKFLLEKIINEDYNINNFLLLGNSGAGKSKFLLKFAYHILQNFEKTKVFPIYVKLALYLDQQNSNKLQSLTDILKSKRISKKMIQFM